MLIYASYFRQLTFIIITITLFSSYEIELRNRVTQNDVTLRVTNSKLFITFLLHSFLLHTKHHKKNSLYILMVHTAEHYKQINTPCYAPYTRRITKSQFFK